MDWHSMQGRSANGRARTSHASLTATPAEDRSPGCYALYRQRSSSTQLGTGDVLVGTFAGCEEALDASDADVLAQLAAVGGFQCEVAHLITASRAAGEVSCYPLVASVGGRRVLRGAELDTVLRDTERWLRSQRLD